MGNPDYTYFEGLVANNVQEALELEFKSSPSLARENKALDELSRDVSAMANSAGGRIVFGIVEAKRDGVPVAVNVDGGVDPAVISREWLEDSLQARIRPRIANLIIMQVPFPNGGVGYVLDIPQATSLAPHQANDQKYYRRFNFKRTAMFDYEIRDLFRRSTTPDLYLNISPMGVVRSGDSDRVHINISVGNRSNTPAEHAAIVVIFPAGSVVRYAPKFTEQPVAYTIYRDGIEQRCDAFSRSISISSELPIFKEIESMLGSFEVRIPTKGKDFLVGYTVRSPGCVSGANGAISLGADGKYRFEEDDNLGAAWKAQ
jgi:hypothetical protein